MSDVVNFRRAPADLKLIETPTYHKIWHVLEDCLANGRLAVIRGGFGVGKTFTLKRFAAEHEHDAAYVALDPTMRALSPGLSRTCLAVEAAWALNFHQEPRGTHRNLSYGPYTLARAVEQFLADYFEQGTHLMLVIDEAQHAQPDLLDAFRGFYDRGLCGLVIAGNENLFNPRRGRMEAADFGALIRRAYHSLNILAPTPEDVNAVLDAYRIAAPESRAFLKQCAAAGGGLEIIYGIEKARELSGTPVPGLKQLKAAMGTTGLSATGWGRRR
jgi:DNA transposition AAA+ family ATPase